jgi:hypothetical protein
VTKSNSKRLPKYFCEDKYDYFVRKLLSNRVILLTIFSHSLFQISGSPNLASGTTIHLRACSSCDVGGGSWGDDDVACLDIEFANYLKRLLVSFSFFKYTLFYKLAKIRKNRIYFD